MRDFLTERARQLKPSGIRKYFDILDTLPNAISLGVGEPDFVTPWDIRSAGIRSLQKGYTSYTGNRGLPELRQLISRYLAERFQADYPADRIIITVGASEGIDLALRTTCEEGDEVLVPDPAYVSYAPIISLCGGVAAPVHCKAENGFIMTPEAIEKAITPRTKAIILAYPNNPTGAVMTREQLEAIVPVIEKYDLLIISDEIYAELTYGGKHCSVASLPGMKERTVLLSGFSKAFAMTGWRIGYACAPEALDKAMLKVHQYTMLCAPRIAQHAAVAALSGGFQDDFASVAQMRAEYDKRRRFLVKSFNDLGLTCFEPRGAFYAFPSVESTGLTGEEFVEGLLKEEQVAVVPGNAFGDSGEGFIRVSYSYSVQHLSAALRRIAEFLQELKGE